MCYVANNTQVNLKYPLRLNNHQQDVNNWNSLQADQHFRLPGHNLNKHAKFTLIEQLNDTNIDKELLKYRLKTWRLLGYNHMDSMLNWISQIPNISTFLVHLFLWTSYAEWTSKTMSQCLIPEVKFVNLFLYWKQTSFLLRAAHGLK